jgi:hypothetical protein
MIKMKKENYKRRLPEDDLLLNSQQQLGVGSLGKGTSDEGLHNPNSYASNSPMIKIKAFFYSLSFAFYHMKAYSQERLTFAEWLEMRRVRRLIKRMEKEDGK